MSPIERVGEGPGSQVDVVGEDGDSTNVETVGQETPQPNVDTLGQVDGDGAEVVGGGVVPVAFTIDIADSVTAIDGAFRAQTASRAEAETITAVDGAFRAQTAGRSIADSVTAADGLTVV